MRNKQYIDYGYLTDCIAQTIFDLINKNRKKMQQGLQDGQYPKSFKILHESTWCGNKFRIALSTPKGKFYFKITVLKTKKSF